MKYKQLSLNQRSQIQYYLSMNLSHLKIATLLGVSNSTISREISRNSITQRRSSDDKYITKYNANTANNMYINRRSKNRVKFTDELLSLLKIEFKEYNSITSIVGKFRKVNPNFPSATTLYYWINIGILNLPKSYINAYKLKRNNRKGKSQSIARDDNTLTIHNRPSSISTRKKFGHWELDLIESAGNGGYIISFIERSTRFTITKYISHKTISNVNSFIYKVMKSYNVNSITTDNGSEFLGLYKLKRFNKQLEIYYCDPGAPYQKGQVEWFNKQLRRFIKKNTTFTNTSIRRISYYTKIVNNQVLNVLNFNSPSTCEYLIKK